jgi:uncharacterized protein (UPF0276 family)
VREDRRRQRHRGQMSSARPSTAPIPAAAGIGLRLPHHPWLLGHAPPVNWLEVHAENYMSAGAARDELEQLAADYPLSLHCVGLSLGAIDGPDTDHLERLRELVQRLQPALISDHLAWTSFRGVHLPDLLPLPYTAECLQKVCDNIDRIQTALQRRILVENPSRYCELPCSTSTEPQFLAELVQRTGCQILLDINNVYVSARNTGGEPAAQLQNYLNTLAPDCIAEIHLAGHCEAMSAGRTVCFDDHGSTVSTEVWELFARAINELGPRPALIEWDTNIPDFPVLQLQAARADELLHEILQPRELACSL